METLSFSFIFGSEFSQSFSEALLFAMSKRLAERFVACRKAKRTALVAFVTAGYPEKKDTVPALLELEKQGADVIELGVPFSDPMADGSEIEAAGVVAIKNGAFKTSERNKQIIML